ncbi:MAG: hypothetical protein EOR00_33355 [Mesorhizobium sp.]|uniref:gamma-glutamylcyclotransferase n=1 Tax=Mesorhizobium sp. TaxID=1871066 RepID=UPI000FE4EC63|nr:gamma-glutamylcyclotransferase [Mesorhizobium sp.]RWP07751.1 MAG: hypothetical protein EOR00_33355 [Mesorhizobium sp.]
MKLAKVETDQTILHIRGFGGDPLGGMSTLHFGRHAFSLARAAAGTFANGLLSQVALIFDRVADAGTARACRNPPRRKIRRCGTVDQPGLMMGLDAGGQCKGMIYRLADDTVEAQLGKLVRREMPVRPSGKPFTHAPRWVRVQTAEGLIHAIAFVVDRKGANYAGSLTPDETAGILGPKHVATGGRAPNIFTTQSRNWRL